MVTTTMLGNRCCGDFLTAFQLIFTFYLRYRKQHSFHFFSLCVLLINYWRNITKNIPGNHLGSQPILVSRAGMPLRWFIPSCCQLFAGLFRPVSKKNCRWGKNSVSPVILKFLLFEGIWSQLRKHYFFRPQICPAPPLFIRPFLTYAAE